MKIKTLIVFFILLLPLTLCGCLGIGSNSSNNETTPTPTPSPNPTPTPLEPPAVTISSITGIKDTYLLNEPFNASNNTSATVHIYYNDNTSETTTLDELNITNFNSSSFGDKKLTITYKNLNYAFDYSIKTEISNFYCSLKTDSDLVFRYCENIPLFSCSFNYTVYGGTRTGNSLDLTITDLNTKTLGQRTAKFSIGGDTKTLTYYVYCMEDGEKVKSTVTKVVDGFFKDTTYRFELTSFRVGAVNKDHLAWNTYAEGNLALYKNDKHVAYITISKCEEYSSIGDFYIYSNKGVKIGEYAAHYNYFYLYENVFEEYSEGSVEFKPLTPQ